jgi:hypothetical protein
MTYFSRMNQTAMLIMVIATTLICGCDDMPRLAIQSFEVKPSVESDGHRRYDWLHTNNTFEVARPTRYTFHKSIDSEKIKQNIRADVPTFYEGIYERPVGLKDNPYRALRRFMERPSSVVKKLLAPSVNARVTAIAMNRAGNLAAMTGTELLLVDTETGERVRITPCPCPAAKHIAFALNETTVIIQDEKSVVRWDVEQGKVERKWETAADPIQAFSVARNTDQVIVLHESGKLTLLDADLSTMAQSSIANAFPKSLCISTTGSQVLAISKNGLFRWEPSQGAEAGYVLVPELVSSNSGTDSICVSGSALNRWIARNQVVESMQQNSLKEYDNPLALNFKAEFMWSGTNDGSQDWLATIGTRGQKKEYFIQDLLVNARRSSTAQQLDCPPMTSVAFNSDTSQFLALTQQGVFAFKRVERIDVAGQILGGQFERLFSNNELDQIELLAKELRAYRGQRGAISGKSIIDAVARYIGHEWTILEQQADEPRLEALEAWYQKGSELSLLASASRHREKGQNARGGGTSSTVTSEGWRIFDTEERLSKVDIDRVFKEFEPSPLAFSLRLDFLRSNLLTDKQADKVIQQGLESWPHSSRPISRVLLHLLPRWGGNVGESGAFLKNATDTLPSPQKERVYASATASFSLAVANAVFSEGKISFSRLRTSMEIAMENELLTADDVELLIKVIVETYSHHECVNKLVAYHQEHFPFKVLNLNYRRSPF